MNNIILTAKNDKRIEFYDGATHQRLAALDMPAPVHELVLSPDGSKAYGSVFGGGVFGRNNVIDTHSDTLVKRVRVEGGNEDRNQLRRVRLSPDERWLLLSSHCDGNVAIFRVPDLQQTALIKVGRAPMGFGFPDAPDQALVCNHDDGLVSKLDLVLGRVTGDFATGNGCEFVEYYAAT